MSLFLYDLVAAAAAAAAKSLQSCPTLCDPMDSSLPGSSIHGIFQARVLESGVITFSNDLAKFHQFVNRYLLKRKSERPLMMTR